MHAFYYLFGISLLLNYRLGVCEVYTAVVDMQEIVHTEKTLIHTLDEYINAETQKLELLSSYLKTYKKENERCSKNTKACVENPFDAYFLIKRLAEDWSQVDSVIKSDVSKEYFANAANLNVPTSEDLVGVRDALIRLRDIYNVNITSFTNGELGKIRHHLKLTATDCLEIGKQCLDNDNFHGAQIWLQEAYAKFGKTNNLKEKSLVLDYLSFAAYKQGNASLALDLTNKLLDISLNDEKALKNKKLYEDLAQNNNANNSEDSDSHEAKSKAYLLDLYQKICREEIAVSEPIASKLRCRYVNNKNPFLFIAPFKLEEKSFNPAIAVFHDVLSDKEIDVIVKTSRSQFERGTITDYQTGKTYASKDKISKIAWLPENDYEYLRVINRRISHMTGLDVRSSEELHVSNYGIGGHFTPHADYFSTKASLPYFQRGTGIGNRLATVLFYFEDVQGGSTVFPYANVTIHPQKGTASFWYNLHLNGEGDIYTTHASCPVISGSKWIMAKWIHEARQEFLRPCGLTLDALEENMSSLS